jgi:hypothetical protein
MTKETRFSASAELQPRQMEQITTAAFATTTGVFLSLSDQAQFFASCKGLRRDVIHRQDRGLY